MVRKRATWLVILFVGEMFTATAMGFFEKQIERAVVLALFVPLIISSGGNSGSQAATLIIRALALGEVRLHDWWRVMRREVVAGLLLGLILAAIGFIRIAAWNAVSLRLRTAPIRPSRLSKRRNTVPLPTPARAATASIVTASTPHWSISSSAATSKASRLRAASLRSGGWSPSSGSGIGTRAA